MHRFIGSRVLAVVAVSAFAMAGGALLAWWQWTRYQSAGGTLQNLGYVLQWPLFGVFPAFMFWRIRRTARRERELGAAASARPAGGPTSTNGSTRVPVPKSAAEPITDATVGDGRWGYVQNRTVTYSVDEDIELLAYNQYLADLSAQSADREHRHAG